MDLNTLILGAGAAGMMAAAHAGPGTLVLDHAKAPGEKIRISGGGRCNFTNMYTDPSRFVASNPHFHKSALARYTQWDFIELVDRYGIAWHEKTLGQLFCDGKATQIVQMLRDEMDKAGAQLWLNTSVTGVSHADGQFHVQITREGKSRRLSARNLIIATGGKSIPKMGATGLAYEIAAQFDHTLIDPRPGLVPLTFEKGRFDALAGVALPVHARAGDTGFDEAMLFTHRGLSGPAILQASSYWLEGAEITLSLLPDTDWAAHLRAARSERGRKTVAGEIATLLPKRLAAYLAEVLDLKGNLADMPDTRINGLADALHHWTLRPTGSEGYRTAEVTLGGVNTDGLSSKTMMSAHVPGLFFIGECVDVTGWLGGYNFQWAWSSGVAAGQAARGR